MNKFKPVLTVGLSGVTCSGKTSIAKMLKASFPSSIVINQDDYFLHPDNGLPVAKIHDKDVLNFDSIESLDMPLLVKTVLSAQQELMDKVQSTNETCLLIIDGFLIFNYQPLADLCDLKYYIQLPFDVCAARRSKRTDYIPPDPPGYFESVAWPMHIAHFDQMERTVHGITYLDGTKSREENFHMIMKDVELHFGKNWINVLAAFQGATNSNVPFIQVGLLPGPNSRNRFSSSWSMYQGLPD